MHAADGGPAAEVGGHRGAEGGRGAEKAPLPRTVRTRRLVAALMLGACAIATLSAAAGDRPARHMPYAAQFPAGEAHDLADRWCRICHSAMLVSQQAKDSTSWEKTIVQMEKWGVQFTPAEHDTLRRYLVSHFGPRPAK